MIETVLGNKANLTRRDLNQSEKISLGLGIPSLIFTFGIFCILGYLAFCKFKSNRARN